MKNLRKKIWIDSFQTKLSLRIAFYFIFYQITLWCLVVIQRHLFFSLEATIGDAAGWFFIILHLGIIYLGLVFIYDAVKYSHRVVGPLVRFRKTIQAIIAKEDVEMITLRKGDFLQELKDEFNEMIKVLEQRGAIEVKDAAANPAEAQLAMK